jgi:hypothetical protein
MPSESDIQNAIIEAEQCPQCKCCDMEWEQCYVCGGDGWLEVYDEDPLWYDPGDVEMCDECESRGGWWFCISGCHVNGGVHATIRE